MRTNRWHITSENSPKQFFLYSSTAHSADSLLEEFSERLLPYLKNGDQFSAHICGHLGVDQQPTNIPEGHNGKVIVDNPFMSGK